MGLPVKVAPQGRSETSTQRAAYIVHYWGPASSVCLGQNALLVNLALNRQWIDPDALHAKESKACLSTAPDVLTAPLVGLQTNRRQAAFHAQ